MDSKFKKAETWDEFNSKWSEYIIVLSDMKEHGQEYEFLVKEWVEYSAVNKYYLHAGPRYVKDDVNNQMMNLLDEKHQILDYYLDIFVYGRKDCREIMCKTHVNFSRLRGHVDNEIEWKETLKKEEDFYLEKQH